MPAYAGKSGIPSSYQNLPNEFKLAPGGFGIAIVTQSSFDSAAQLQPVLYGNYKNDEGWPWGTGLFDTGDIPLNVSSRH